MRPRDLLRDADFAPLADAETAQRLAAIVNSAATIANQIEQGRAAKSKQSSPLRMRFGLDGRTERTLQEIGSAMSLSRERIRQIEVDALRKLRPPSKRDGLESYLAA